MNHSRFCANDNGITAGRSTATNGSSTPRTLADARCQLRDRRRFEQGANRKAGIQRLVDRSDDPHRRQRIPAQVEERVVNPDPLQPQYLSVDPGQELLSEVSWRAEMIGLLVARCGRARLSSFPLAVRGSASSTTTADGTI